MLTPEKESTSPASATEPTLWDKTVYAAWRFRSLHLSRTEAQYLTLQLAMGVMWPDIYDTLQQLAQPPARALEAVDKNGTIIYGAACPLPTRVRHLYECRPVPPIDIAWTPQHHWLPIAIDGTNRHEASYVHCTIGGITSPNELASWWLMGGSEQWSTIYALAQEVDFDHEGSGTHSVERTGDLACSAAWYCAHTVQSKIQYGSLGQTVGCVHCTNIVHHNSSGSWFHGTKAPRAKLKNVY